MKSLFKITFLGIIFFSLSSIPTHSAKIIQLKDGSVLKGDITGLQNSVYTVQTPHLGTVQIADSEIVNITDESFAGTTSSNSNNITQVKIKEQAQAAQNTLLNDPALMQEMQALMEDPEIRALLSDPALLAAAMTYDPAKMEQNENVKKLLANPKMQNFLQKMSERIP